MPPSDPNPTATAWVANPGPLVEYRWLPGARQEFFKIGFALTRSGDPTPGSTALGILIEQGLVQVIVYDTAPSQPATVAPSLEVAVPDESLLSLEAGPTGKFDSTGAPPPPSGVLTDSAQPIHQPIRTTEMPSAERWWIEDTERWSNWVSWVSKDTRADYLRHLRGLPGWLARLGLKPPTNAHEHTAEMVMAISWDRDRSGSARQKVLVVWKLYLGWKGVPLAADKRLWREAMEIDTSPDPTRLRRLSPAETVKLTQIAKTVERWTILVALALWMGLRQGEIRNLRRGDVDFENRRIHVRYGKGRKTRHLPMSSVAERLLEPLRNLEDDYEPVYPFGRTTLARDLWRACNAAGIPRYSPHDLRRTCVRMTKAGGANPRGRQLLLGHARFEQTAHYEGEDDLELVDAVDKLSEYGERLMEGD